MERGERCEECPSDEEAAQRPEICGEGGRQRRETMRGMPGARCGESGRTRLLPGLWEVLMGKDPPMCPRCGSGSALPAPSSPSHAVGPRLGSPRGSRAHRVPPRGAGPYPGTDVSMAELWLWDTPNATSVYRWRGRGWLHLRGAGSEPRASKQNPNLPPLSTERWDIPTGPAVTPQVGRAQTPTVPWPGPPPPSPADTSGWESTLWGEEGINRSTRPSQPTPPSFREENRPPDTALQLGAQGRPLC